jgi:hypothetical protein
MEETKAEKLREMAISSDDIETVKGHILDFYAYAKGLEYALNALGQKISVKEG